MKKEEIKKMLKEPERWSVCVSSKGIVFVHDDGMIELCDNIESEIKKTVDCLNELI